MKMNSFVGLLIMKSRIRKEFSAKKLVFDYEVTDIAVLVERI